MIHIYTKVIYLHSLNYLLISFLIYLIIIGHGGDGDDMNWHQLSDAVHHHQEKQKHHGHDIHKEVRDSLVQHHRHGHRDHHNDYHDAYKHTHGTHSNIGGH